MAFEKDGKKGSKLLSVVNRLADGGLNNVKQICQQNGVPNKSLTQPASGPSGQQYNNTVNLVSPEKENEVVILTNDNEEKSSANGANKTQTNVYCTACNKKLNIKKSKICKHAILGVLICKSCLKFMNSSVFTRDEMGIEENCTWCGDGGDLVCCDFCEKAFCKHCIKRNLGKDFLKAVCNAESDLKWECLSCDRTQLEGHVEECNAVLKSVEAENFKSITTGTTNGCLSKTERKERLSKLANEVSGAVFPVVKLKSSFESNTKSAIPAKTIIVTPNRVVNSPTNAIPPAKPIIQFPNKVNSPINMPSETTINANRSQRRSRGSVPSYKESNLHKSVLKKAENNLKTMNDTSKVKKKSKKKKQTVIVLSSEDESESDEEIIVISKSGKKKVISKSIVNAVKEMMEKDKKKENEDEKKKAKKPFQLKINLNMKDITSPESSESNTQGERIVVDDQKPGPSGIRPRKQKRRQLVRNKPAESSSDEDFYTAKNNYNRKLKLIAQGKRAEDVASESDAIEEDCSLDVVRGILNELLNKINNEPNINVSQVSPIKETTKGKLTCENEIASSKNANVEDELTEPHSGDEVENGIIENENGIVENEDRSENNTETTRNIDSKTAKNTDTETIKNITKNDKSIDSEPVKNGDLETPMKCSELPKVVINKIDDNLLKQIISSDSEAELTPLRSLRKRKPKESKIDQESDDSVVKQKTQKRKTIQKQSGNENNDQDSDNSVIEKKTRKQMLEKQSSNDNNDIDSDDENSDNSVVEKKPRKRKTVEKQSSTEIESEENTSKNHRTKHTRKKKRVTISDSDASVSDSCAIESSSSDGEEVSITSPPVKRKRRKRNAKKDDESESENEEAKTPSKGRKKIRKILKDSELNEETIHARELEEQRRKRLLERTKVDRKEFDHIVEENEKDLVLERNEEKQALVSVDEDISVHLKPHQRKGIQFMYDCCIESVKSYKKGDQGGGCLLAHCMGLGKTLQVVSFIHTVKSSKNLKLKSFIVVAPLNTVLNWEQEFDKWLSCTQRIDLFVLSYARDNKERLSFIRDWHKNGGVLIIGYEMYRNLTTYKFIKSKKMKDDIKRCLVDPGPDLVVCDEGHVLRNTTSAISKAMNQIKTRRRIVLTGTPLQNNLIEYHCMVDFIKPNLLGTKKEFQNRFVNPIKNGQCSNSTAFDVRIMKQRCHILYQILSGCVQRQDYSVLTPFLPPKHEYTIFVRLQEKQIKIYKHYLENFVYTDALNKLKGSSLFSDFHCLSRVWTHPWALHLERERQALRNRYKEDDSIDEFIDDEGEDETDGSEDNDKAKKPWTMDTSSDEEKKEASRRKNRKAQVSASESDTEEEVEKKEVVKPSGRATRASRRTQESIPLNSGGSSKSTSANNSDNETVEVKPSEPRLPPSRGCLRSGINFKDASANPERQEEELEIEKDWYDEYTVPEDEHNIELSGKLVLLMEILADAEVVGDKVLVFSQSLVTLALIESALGGGFKDGNQMDWCHGVDYFRMDGSTPVHKRKRWADIFNDPQNEKCRLFLISTRAGSLGINMVGANRVIIFDCSWNPSHDVQSVFRVYRFGQDKPVYVYRFIAQGTMEEKIYGRQITKLATAGRVVDEQQIERHFSQEEIRELYSFAPAPIKEGDATPQLPKDPLLAEVLQRQHPKNIVRYHEHDILLENVESEELTEEERKQAWKSYEQEKENAVNNLQFRQNMPNMPHTTAQNTTTSLQQLLQYQQQLLQNRLQQPPQPQQPNKILIRIPANIPKSEYYNYIRNQTRLEYASRMSQMANLAQSTNRFSLGQRITPNLQPYQPRSYTYRPRNSVLAPGSMFGKFTNPGHVNRNPVNRNPVNVPTEKNIQVRGQTINTSKNPTIQISNPKAKE